MTDLTNQSVQDIRQMTSAELEREGWQDFHGDPPTVIVFEDGTKVFPAQDSEGNGPGALFGVDCDGDLFEFSV